MPKRLTINTCRCAYTHLPSSIGALHAFALSCIMLLHLKRYVFCVFCVCAPINHSPPPPSLSSLSFYHLKLFRMFFFFCFMSLVTPLFHTIILQQHIHVSSKNKGLQYNTKQEKRHVRHLLIKVKTSKHVGT